MGSRRRRTAKASSVFSIWASLATLASALNFTAVELPDIQTEDYGRMGLIGNYDSISLYQYPQQGGQTLFSNGSHAIMTQLPNGELTTLVLADGHINDMCLFTMQNGTVAGIIVGGNFTTVGGIAAEGVALLRPDTGTPIPLTGLSGSVNALLCDSEANTVYVGGEFSGANSTNAIAWVGMDGWSELPFQGFNGAVESISRLPNGTVIFGGQFSTIGNESLISNPNGTHKLTQQVINLETATLTATLGSTRDGFGNPENIVCGNGTGADNVFLLEDGQPGSLSAELSSTIYPTKLRLYNTQFEDRGLKTFRFISRPNNGIMNLTSVDPVSGERFYCQAECSLSHDTNETVPYQDFEFVNVIPTYAFRIEALEWYGAGAGLNGIELFQDDIYAFADNNLNEPSCKNLDIPSSSTNNGTWTSTGGPPFTDSKYLTASFSGAELDRASVTFRPDIKISGIYTVLVYTPGCLQDDTCGERGQVTVSGKFSSNQTDETETTYYQTNNFDKYDTLFRGYVEANNAEFAPEITLRPRAGQEGTFTLVASKVRFIIDTEIDEGTIAENAVSSAGGGSLLTLNGVFAFNPTAAVDSMEQNLAINLAGDELPDNVTINTVSVLNERIFLGGDIETDTLHNFVIVDGQSGVVPSTLGGLNGIVIDTYLTGQLMYLAGRFNDTVNEESAGLSYVASYNVDTGAWGALGSGLDASPAKIASMTLDIAGVSETVFVFSGDFTKILSTGSAPEVDVDGIAVWVPARNDWLERLPDASYSMAGFLSAVVTVPDSPPFFAGSFFLSKKGLTGAAALVQANDKIELRPLGVPITLPEQSTQNSNRKRALDPSLGFGLDGVQAAAFYNKFNVTILGGRFSSGDVENLALIYGDQNNRLSGVPDNALGGDNVVTSLLLTSGPDKLYIGGAINSTLGGLPIGGLAVWNLENNEFVNPQPQPLLNGDNQTVVYTVTQQPNGKLIYVGGAFLTAGTGFGCAGVCTYDPDTTIYTSPGSNQLSGVAYASAWTDADTYVAGGELIFNDTTNYLATFTVSTSQWAEFPGARDNLPGPVTTIFTPVGEENNVYVGGNADGNPFIYRYDGTKWTNLASDFLLPGSIVQGIEVFEIGQPHAQNDLLADNQILMASGNILLRDHDISSSAAIFDGTRWSPFILTTNKDGAAGSLSAFVSQSKHTFNAGAGRLAVGLVVLISLAIALGLIFLIVVIGVLASYIRRRREGYAPAPTRSTPVPNPQHMTEIVPPDQLFQGVGQSSRIPPHI